MKKTRSIEWFKFDEGESLGHFATSQNESDDYICPTCGEPCVYCEGQIDQDQMGNDIHGWWFDCYACKISSESMEGTWGYDYS